MNKTKLVYLTLTILLMILVVGVYYTSIYSQPKKEVVSRMELFDQAMGKFSKPSETTCKEEDFDCMLSAAKSCKPNILIVSPEGIFPVEATYEIIGLDNGLCKYKEKTVGSLILSKDTPKKVTGIRNNTSNYLLCSAPSKELIMYLEESFKQIRDLHSGVSDPLNYTKTDDFIKNKCKQMSIIYD